MILHKYGGIWSDLDIVYTRSITDVIDFDFDTVNFLCKAIPHEVIYIPIGLLLSKRGKRLFFDIYKSGLQNYDKKKYQSVGSSNFKTFLIHLKRIIIREKILL